MNEGDAVDLVQSAIWMIIVGAGPAVGAAMVVGVAIALLQALTQVQEMTLTFVPKMIAIFVAARRQIFGFYASDLRANRARLQLAASRGRGGPTALSATPCFQRLECVFLSLCNYQARALKNVVIASEAGVRPFGERRR